MLPSEFGSGPQINGTNSGGGGRKTAGTRADAAGRGARACPAARRADDGGDGGPGDAGRDGAVVRADRLPPVPARCPRHAPGRGRRQPGTAARLGPLGTVLLRPARPLRHGPRRRDGLLARRRAEVGPRAGRAAVLFQHGQQLAGAVPEPPAPLALPQPPARRRQGPGGGDVLRRRGARRCRPVGGLAGADGRHGDHRPADRVRLPVPDGHPAAAVGGQRKTLVPAGPAAPGDRRGRGAADVLFQPPDVAGRAAPHHRVRNQGRPPGHADRAGHHAPTRPERLPDQPPLQRHRPHPLHPLLRRHRLLLPPARRRAVLRLVLLRPDPPGAGGGGGLQHGHAVYAALPAPRVHRLPDDRRVPGADRATCSGSPGPT